MASASRRLYIDWLRGLAVVLMILWHSIDSWTITGGRDTSLFKFIEFCAGWPAPLFLFLAGLSLPLAMTQRMSRGASMRAASRSIQVRGWEIFLAAHLFRAQSFLLDPHAGWSALLTPDILNILGLGIVAVGVALGHARTPRAQAFWLLAPVVIIIGVITPLAGRWWWPTLLPPRLEAYIRPVPGFGVFSLFPTVAFVFAGGYLGTWLTDPSRGERRLHLVFAIAGAAAVVAAESGGRFSVPAAIRPWTVQLFDFTFRCGAMTFALGAIWALLRVRPVGNGHPLIVFGRTSLFVYWVHVELAYGAVSYPLHHALTLHWALVAYTALTVFMLGAAVLWQRRPKGGPLIPPHMVAQAGT